MVPAFRSVHFWAPLVLALLLGLPASAIAVVAVKAGVLVHSGVHDDVAVARESDGQAVAETVAEGRSEVGSWERQTIASAAPCASACEAAAVGEDIDDSGACLARFVGCRWPAGAHMRSHSPEDAEDALGDAPADDLAEARMDRLEERPG